MAFLTIRLFTTFVSLVPLYSFYKYTQIAAAISSSRRIRIDRALFAFFCLNFGTRFLTIWAIIMQIVNMAGYCLHDVLEMMGVSANFCSKLKSRVDACFYHLTSGVNIFVTVAYWTLYIYNKELVMISIPLIGYVAVPFWIDLSVHLLNTLNIFLHAWNDDNFFKHKNTYWPLCCFHLLYCSWFYLLAWIDDVPVSVYPLTDRLMEPYRFFFAYGLAFASPLPKNILYYICRRVYLSKNERRVYGKEKEK